MLIWLIDTAAASEQEQLFLPSWPVQKGLLWLLLAFVMWCVGFLLPKNRYSFGRSFLQSLVLLFGIMGFGAFLPDAIQRWVLLVIIIGFGWSMRDLFIDLFAGFLLFLEKRIFIGSWVSGPSFSGRVVTRNWRYVGLQNVKGIKSVVPNREFLSHVVEVSTIGFFTVTLRFVVPEGISILLAEKIARSWIVSSPWVSDNAIVVYPDPSNEGVLIIQLTLLGPEYEDDFIHALRWQLEEAKKRQQQV